MKLPDGFSSSMKRATIMFLIPGDGRIIIQEPEGKASAKLREAIAKARKKFFQEYNKVERARAGEYE